MKKLMAMLLLAAFSISSFASVLPQQDTTRRTTKKTQKTTPKSKQTKTKKSTWKKTKRDTMRMDTPMHRQVH